MSMDVTPLTAQTTTRFAMTLLEGNQVVDWAVIRQNFDRLGTRAAHVGLQTTGPQVGQPPVQPVGNGNNFLGPQHISGNLTVTANMTSGSYDATDWASNLGTGQPDVVVGLVSGQTRLRIWPRTAIVSPTDSWTWNGTELVPTMGHPVAAYSLRADTTIVAAGRVSSNTSFWLPFDCPIHWNDTNYRIFTASDANMYFDSWYGWTFRHANGPVTALRVDYIGNVSAQGQLWCAGRLITNQAGPWDPGWSNVLNGSAMVNGPLQTTARLITNNWDIGWANSLGGDTLMAGRLVAGNWNIDPPGATWTHAFGGTVIVSSTLQAQGAVISRAAYRCWDAADFPGVSPSNIGAYLVQRDGNGDCTVGHFNCYGMDCYGDARVYTTFYVMNGASIAFEVAAISGEVFTNAPVHMSHAMVFNQVTAYNSYDAWHLNAFLCPDNGDYPGQGLANQWRTWSSERVKRNVEPIQNALTLVRDPALHGVRYDHIDQVSDEHGGYRASGTTTPQVGFVADHWLPYFPEIVGVDREGKAESMDYSRVTAVLWEAVKELTAEVDDLKRKLAA